MDIYILDLNKFNTTLLQTNLAQKNFTSTSKQNQHLAGRYILQDFATKHNMTNAEIIYKNQKPYYKNNEYFFSISHSANLVVVGFEKFEIGLDIENNTKIRNYIPIIKRFDNNLATQISSKSTEEQQQLFYEFWTKYEAKIKLNSPNSQIYYLTKKINNHFTLSIAAEKKISKIKTIIL